MLVRKLLCWWWWIVVVVWVRNEVCFIEDYQRPSFDMTSRSETTHLTRVWFIQDVQRAALMWYKDQKRQKRNSARQQSPYLSHETLFDCHVSQNTAASDWWWWWWWWWLMMIMDGWFRGWERNELCVIEDYQSVALLDIKVRNDALDPSQGCHW